MVAILGQTIDEVNNILNENNKKLYVILLMIIQMANGIKWKKDLELLNEILKKI